MKAAKNCNVSMVVLQKVALQTLLDVFTVENLCIKCDISAGLMTADKAVKTAASMTALANRDPVHDGVYHC